MKRKSGQSENQVMFSNLDGEHAKYLFRRQSRIHQIKAEIESLTGIKDLKNKDQVIRPTKFKSTA